MPIHSGFDLFLLLLYAEVKGVPKEVRGTTRLMKEIFLLAVDPKFRDVAKKDLKFSAYDFGPYSPDVTQAVEMLANRRFVQVRQERISGQGALVEVADDVIGDVASNPSMVAPPASVPTYSLTERGEQVAEELWRRLRADEKAVVLHVKRESNSKPLNDLLREVYTKYPHMRQKSRILWELGFGLGSLPDLTAPKNGD